MKAKRLLLCYSILFLGNMGTVGERLSASMFANVARAVGRGTKKPYQWFKNLFHSGQPSRTEVRSEEQRRQYIAKRTWTLNDKLVLAIFGLDVLSKGLDVAPKLISAITGLTEYYRSLKPKIIDPSEIETGMDDVGGNQKTKQDLMTLIVYPLRLASHAKEMYKETEEYKKGPRGNRKGNIAPLRSEWAKAYSLVALGRIGAKPPRGVLFYGPPGTGKTLLMQAVAKEAGVKTVLLEVGALAASSDTDRATRRLKTAFSEAHRIAPSIIILDEIDAIAGNRADPGNAGKTKLLNQLLTELEGFGEDTIPVTVLAATNTIESLDPALTRSGRFDLKISVPLPDTATRYEILKVMTRDMNLAEDVDLHEIARHTDGLSGADLATLLNEAALMAIAKREPQVKAEYLLAAMEHAMVGYDKEILDLTEDQVKTAAVHEAAHAVVAKMLKREDIIGPYVSIRTVSTTFGSRKILPRSPKWVETKKSLMQELVIRLSGMAAEDVILGERSTASANDLIAATELARDMVERYGFGASGLIAVSAGRTSLQTAVNMVTTRRYISQKAANEAFEAARELLKEAFEEAKRLVKDSKEVIEHTADELAKKGRIRTADIIIPTDAVATVI